MEEEILKTVTVGGDEPEFSYVEGHVDVKTFNTAFKAEGWRGDDFPRTHIQKGYIRKSKDGVYFDVDKNSEGAVKASWVVW